MSGAGRAARFRLRVILSDNRSKSFDWDSVMPVVLRWMGCRFFFFSNEGDPREPVHIHIKRQGARAKFWLDPVSVAENYGFRAHDLSDLARVVDANRVLIERAWHEHFGD